MAPAVAIAPARRHHPPQTSTIVMVVGWLMALWCVAFAAVNAGFEITGHMSGGPYARYAAGFAVMNWLVFALKILGAAVALLSVLPRPRLVSPAVLAVAVWGAFATLGVYALGSLGQAAAMVSGPASSPDAVDLRGVAYVGLFLLAAVGFGVLARSHMRRHDLRWRYALAGLLGAPVVLGLVLLVVPALLATVGLLPRS
jgi:hypothetical protein